MKFAVVIEKAESNYSAFVPDLPGCIATGSTIEEVETQPTAICFDDNRISVSSDMRKHESV